MNPQQVGRAGELYVAAEIHRRGGYAVTFAGNLPGTDMLACDVTKCRRISIQVQDEALGHVARSPSRRRSPVQRRSV
jgi:hypothetical protein